MKSYYYTQTQIPTDSLFYGIFNFLPLPLSAVPYYSALFVFFNYNYNAFSYQLIRLHVGNT